MAIIGSTDLVFKILLLAPVDVFVDGKRVVGVTKYSDRYTKAGVLYSAKNNP